MRIRVLVAVALVGTARLAGAQRLSSAALALAGEAPTHTTKCFSCFHPKRPLRAFGELMIVQLIPWSINAAVRDKEWAHVTPETWEENLENPWQWDNDHFV